MLIISYDLNKRGQDYPDLHNAIKSLGAWWHYLDSTWLLKTNLSSQQVSDRLRQHIDSNDSLLVIEVNPWTGDGWLPKSVWNWIQS